MSRLVNFVYCVALCGVLFSTPVANAEDVNTIFKKVNEYITANNYPKALEELNWAKKEIEKMHVEKLKNFFSDELLGFTGEKFKVNSALGMTNLERQYKKSGVSDVTVSLSGSGAGAGAMGGLAGIGRMAALMGQQQGQEAFRIDGRTASLNVNDRSNRAELSVFLESGSILKLETRNTTDGESLKKLAEAFKISELDSYLRGAS